MPNLSEGFRNESGRSSSFCCIDFLHFRVSVMAHSDAGVCKRVWDFKKGDTYRGRRIATIQGVVGLANNPVAIFSFDEEGTHTLRFPAAYAENMQHGDAVVTRARCWVRSRGLGEGSTIDLDVLRAAVGV